MIKLLEKKRRVLRKIFLIFGTVAVSLMFSACYGPMMSPMHEDEHWSSPPATEVEDDDSENTGA